MKSLIIANWKMNHGIKVGKETALCINNGIKKNWSSNIVIAPPFHVIYHLKETIEKRKFLLAAQDCSEYVSGAYTGDISACMLKEIGCKYVIIGHSERRTLKKESNLIIKKKLINAFSENIDVVLCVGENEREYSDGKSFAIVKKQLLSSIPNNIKIDNKLIIAYEPIWAIGTNKTPTTNEIKNMHISINKTLLSNLNISFTKILYGGSLNSNNAKEILSLDEVDGSLIGGASLDAKEFLKICTIASKI